MTVSKIRLPDNTEHDIRAKYLIQSTSSDVTSAEFSARTVTEDAIANIQKIYGNTIKWNQMLTAQYLSVAVSGVVSAFSSSADGTYTITLSGAATAVINTSNAFPRFFAAGHKYYMRLNSSNLTYLVGRCPAIGDYTSQSQIVSISSSFDETSSANTFRFRIKKDAPAGTYTIRPWIVDLTAIYGSGNEPTVSEFEAQYPADYYPYSPLTLLSNSATAIQSKDSGNNVIGNCDLNIPTLTGKLNGAGSSVVIFPDGMKMAGTVYDEIVGNKAIKRVGSVDMGTLTWSYLDSYTVFYADIADLPSVYTTNMLCVKYTAKGIIYTSLADKEMSNRSGYHRLYVKDSAYTTAASFKTAMSGVMLYYELDSPQEYILDNALQLQYPVVAGGTEMVLPTTGTAPMKMDVIYGNAADAAATMPQNYISVDSMKQFLDKLGTQMGGTWSMGYENGKHTFTFTSN